VDGTLIDANELDSDSFDRAYREIMGAGLPESMWSTFDEVTSQAVIHQALGKGRDEDLSLSKDRVRDSFLANLQAGHGQDAMSIRAFAGAVELISSLKAHADLNVAIATGCWRETAQFKLTAAGFDLTDVPFACASDRYGRAEIISLAAELAGIPIEQAIYVGVWDLKATRQLGIPFIGVGRKIEALRKAGAEHILDSFDAETFTRVLESIRQ
jgi:phosphoglycolate phosphatase-like HAD superfamily hydrolase